MKMMPKKVKERVRDRKRVWQVDKQRLRKTVIQIKPIEKNF